MISILKLGQVLKDSYIGEFLLSMVVDLSNIMLNLLPMIGLSLWTPSERSWEAGDHFLFPS